MEEKIAVEGSPEADRLIIIRGDSRGLCIQKVFCPYRCGYRGEGRRILIEIQAVGKVVGDGVAGAQARKRKDLFRQLQETSELMLVMRNVAMLRPRRDNDQGHPETQPHVIHLRRDDMIVPSTPIVPTNQNEG